MPDPDPSTPGERLATIAGRWRTSGHVIGEPKISVLGIARNRESMTALWERSDDGITWHPWMDIHVTLADDTSGSRLA
jgi:hypothetical protein